MEKGLTSRQRYWLEHIRAAMAGGGTVAEYAKQHGLSIAGLYNAKSVLSRLGALRQERGEAATERFVTVRIKPSRGEPMRCELKHGSGWTLIVTELPSAAWLRALVEHGDVAP